MEHFKIKQRKPNKPDVERLKIALQHYHLDALQEIAETLAVKPEQLPARKGSLVRDLSRLIPRLARSQEYVESLSPAERAILAIAVETDSLITYQDLAKPLILGGMVFVKDQPETLGQSKLRDLLLRLLHRGLIVNLTNSRNPSTLRRLTHFNTLGVPPEVARALPTALLSIPDPDRDAIYPDGDIAQIDEGDVRQYVRELFFIWSELVKEPARQLKAGGMGKRDRRRLASALGLDNDAGLETISDYYRMLAALKIASGDGTTISAIESDAVTLFWSASLVHQLHDLIRAYTQLTDDLVTDDQAASYIRRYFRGFTLRPAAELRAQVVDRLTDIADLDWVSLPVFVALVTSGRPGTWALDDTTLDFVLENLQWYGAGYREEVEQSFDRLERYLTTTILKELHALGLVDLAYTETMPKDDPIGVRVTDILRAHFKNRHPTGAESPQAWQVILQPDSQMLAMGPVPLSMLANLDRFAEREKIDENVVTYRITRDGGYRAFQRGETVEAILSYLEEATGQPVPQNIARSLEAWQQQYERIIIRRQVIIMQVDHPKRMTQLLEDPELQGCLHRLDGVIAWLLPEDVPRVERRLVELDILPAHSHRPEDDLPNSLYWQDGKLMPRAAPPSLYVSGRLRSFAEPNKDHWQISPQTIQTAVALGADPLEIIATLETMVGQPLSADWKKRVKSWGQYYGEGQVAEVRLLRLQRPDALAELREADARLHRWLRPLPGTNNLAVVNADHWREVSELLTSWGVEVTTNRWWQ